MTQEVLVVSETEQLIIQEVEGQSVTEQVVSQEILSEGIQGPPGPPGPPGSILHTETAAIALGGHRAVLIGASGASYADNQTESHAGRAAGVTTGAASMGSQVGFQSSGKLTEASWTWVPDGDIWLGVAGQLTQTYPSGAVFAQRLGYAISATEMWIDLVEPIIY